MPTPARPPLWSSRLPRRFATWLFLGLLTLSLGSLHAQPAEPATAASATAPAAPAPAASAPADPGTANLGLLDARTEALKAALIRLNRDLLVLEEELLFPANTQVSVFVSLDVGQLFALDSVQLRLDDQAVAAHLYTERELQALRRGGVQRLFLGNLRAGEHTLVATFTGKGPHERDYKRGATLKFDKGAEARFIELRIRDSAERLQPEFDIKVWQ